MWEVHKTMHKTMINVINSFWGSSGYSSHGRSLCNALNKLTKVKISTNLMPGWEIQVNDAELEMIKREEDFEINLIITHPLNWKVHLNAKRNFVYLIWEGDKIPKWMILECLNPKIEKIIVPSEHTKQAVLNTLKELFIPELTPVLGALILTEYSFKREEYEKNGVKVDDHFQAFQVMVCAFNYKGLQKNIERLAVLLPPKQIAVYSKNGATIIAYLPFSEEFIRKVLPGDEEFAINQSKACQRIVKLIKASV